MSGQGDHGSGCTRQHAIRAQTAAKARGYSHAALEFTPETDSPFLGCYHSALVEVDLKEWSHDRESAKAHCRVLRRGQYRRCRPYRRVFCRGRRRAAMKGATSMDGAPSAPGQKRCGVSITFMPRSWQSKRRRIEPSLPLI